MSQTNLIQFPKLGLSFNVSNVAFTIFGVDIYWYGVVIGLGMALAVLFAFKNATRFGIDIDRMIDVIFIGFVCAIVGGRLYYVVFVDGRYRTFFELIDLRSGGIAIYGAIIGAFVGAFFACRWRKVPTLAMFDLTATGFLIGQSLGRWGNFFNQEAFGTNTTGVFGMISPATTQYLYYRQEWLSAHGIFVDPYMPVHPTFLYESVWCAIGFILLWRYIPHRKFNGEMALFYAIWYGAGRFFIEGLRTDPLLLPGLNFPVSQLLAALSVVGGLAAWLAARHKTRGQPLQVATLAPHTAKVKVPTPDGEEEVTILWPANQRAPSKDERLSLAHTVLRVRKEEGEEEGEDGAIPTANVAETGTTDAEDKAHPANAAKPDGEAKAQPQEDKSHDRDD